jgi:hypothetical protein
VFSAFYLPYIQFEVPQVPKLHRPKLTLDLIFHPLDSDSAPCLSISPQFSGLLFAASGKFYPL